MNKLRHVTLHYMLSFISIALVMVSLYNNRTVTKMLGNVVFKLHTMLPQAGLCRQ